MARKKLGTMLLEAGLISEQSLRVALNEQKRWGGTLGRMLIEMKLVTELDLVNVLSAQLNIEIIDLELLEIPQAVIDLVPGELAEQHSLVPFAQQMKFLDVAMADPTNLGIIDELRIRTQLNIRPYLAGPKAIEKAVGKYYNRGLARFAQRAHVPLDMDIGDAMPLEPSVHEERPVEHEHESGLRPFPRQTLPPQNIAEIRVLQDRISELEALVARDEGVLRKLLALLVEKGIATREEILERIK